MLQAIKLSIYKLLILLIFIISIVFFLKNQQSVAIDYFFGSLDISLPLLVFITFILGLLLGIAVYLPKIIVLQRKFKKLEKKHLLLSSKSDV